MKYPIVEIFSSIQGEGCNLGKPANFIRFAGCNLNCPWCDTEWNKPKLGVLSIDEILKQLDSKVPFVVLTGGEPTIQPQLADLIQELYKAGYSVAMETNGTKATINLLMRFPDMWITCSPKPQMEWETAFGVVYNEIKYVVDGQFTKDRVADTSKPIWLQPEGSNMQEAWKEALQIQRELLHCGLDVRIGVQLHKIMEVR